jgi:hypothetical protein
MRTGRPPQPEEVYRLNWEARLQNKIQLCQETGCWFWTATLNSKGYGNVKLRVGGKWITGQAHREIYQVYRGPVPENLELDHLCLRTNCVNPWHLEAVTHKVNIRRGYGRNDG